MKAFTDIEQSKKLAEFLSHESADMWWAERYAGQVMVNGQYIVEEKPVYYPSLTKPSNVNYSQDTVKDIPCWSLAALLEALPKVEFHPTLKRVNYREYYISYNSELFTKIHDNPIDACYEMIIKLHELKIF